MKSSELRAVLADLPHDGDEPVFNAPWEAQAFAMTLALHERGVFEWKEWAACLATAIRNAHLAGDPDSGESYYRHWMTALENISTAKGLVTNPALVHRRDEWDEAARRTPHGQPISLDR